MAEQTLMCEARIYDRVKRHVRQCTRMAVTTRQAFEWTEDDRPFLRPKPLCEECAAEWDETAIIPEVQPCVGTGRST